MKALLKILLGGFVVFMALAMIQEYQVFVSLLPGHREAAAEPPAGDPQPVIDALRLFLSLMSHMYSSGGDPRFSDRLPAADPVVEEIITDVVYLRHNQRRQEPRLLRFEVRDAAVGADRARVTTREYWVIRTFSVHHGRETEPPRSAVLNVEYLLARQGRRWQVMAWNLTSAPEPEVPAAEAPLGGAGASPLVPRGDRGGIKGP